MTTAAQVEVLNINGITVIRPGTDLANLFEAQLEHIAVISTLAESASPPRLIVDLQHVKVVGSAFLGRMVAANKTIAARDGGLFALCNVSTFCRSALSVSKLDTVINVQLTLDDAICALS